MAVQLFGQKIMSMTSKGDCRDPLATANAAAQVLCAKVPECYTPLYLSLCVCLVRYFDVCVRLHVQFDVHR